LVLKAKEWRNTRYGANEAETRRVLVEPLLRWLGWDLHDVDEVRSEWCLPGSRERSDYALFIDGKPVLVVEAKAFKDPLDNDKGWAQVMANAMSGGASRGVRASGRRVILFDLYRRGTRDEKIVVSIDLTEVGKPGRSLDETAAALWNLSRETMLLVGQSEEQRRREAAENAIDKFLGNPPAGLTAEDLRACLAERFGGIQPVPPGPTPPGPVGGTVTIENLLDAGIVRAGDRWFATKRTGDSVEGEITANGKLLVNGKEYASHSVAGKRVNGLKACNGWVFWKYRDRNGDLRPTDELKTTFLARLA
jgi:hypothetical protein